MARFAKAYNHSMQSSKSWKFPILIMVIFTAFVFIVGSRNGVLSPLSMINAYGNSMQFQNDVNSIKALTWNMAAINNNPFEYWITTDIQSYNNMMANVSNVIQNPGQYPSLDLEISSFFTDSMFEELLQDISQHTNWGSTASSQISNSNMNIVKDIWHNDYKKRKAISQFLKDPLLGKKRLASMPDRLTNTISSSSSSSSSSSNDSTKSETAAAFEPLMRPTVINCYSGGELSSIPLWWTQWRHFLFHTRLTPATAVTAATQGVRIVDTLLPIRRSKYPAITEEEEKVSLPLQLLTLALFDAILIHTLNIIAPPPPPSLRNDVDTEGNNNDINNSWEPVRNTLCNQLNRKKSQRTLEILESQYSRDMNILFLQEVGAAFIRVFYHPPSSSSPSSTTTASSTPLHELYDMYTPQDKDGDRDQNSVILLRKGGQFTHVKEVTSDILQLMAELAGPQMKIPVSKGDLLCLTVTSTFPPNSAAIESTTRAKEEDSIIETITTTKSTRKNRSSNNNNNHKSDKYLLCSFHGDTNGLATIPILTAVRQYAVSVVSDHLLLFGMDANAYQTPEKDQLGVDELAAAYRKMNLNSCYGLYPDKIRNVTTCHARTHLQTQLNKAVSLEDKEIRGDRNPKDFILFFAADFKMDVSNNHHLSPSSSSSSLPYTIKDNTGRRGVYLDHHVFPTLSFPSDHAITATHLIRLRNGEEGGGDENEGLKSATADRSSANSGSNRGSLRSH